MVTAEPVVGTAVAEQTGATDLRFDRTVDRALLHREALSEVFVTDSRGSAAGFTVAAQLPASHAFYDDHVVRCAAPDPLLVLECCRQAETLGVHAYFGAPRATAFVLRRWSVDLPRLPGTAVRGKPAPLLVDVVPRNTAWNGDEVRGATYDMTVTVADRPVGTVTMSVGYVPGASYPAVRRRQRGSPPPQSSELTATVADRVPVPARSVGRTDARNVLLERVRETTDGTSAFLIPDLTHPSLFDHPQDHLPGMTLMEGARQAALHNAGTFGLAAPEHTIVTGLDARFGDYTELDRLTRVRASRPRRHGDRHAVTVTVEQDGRATAEAEVLLDVLDIDETRRR